MSAVRSTTIQCDGCGVASSGDLQANPASEMRRQARFDGWHVALPGGRDICEACWEEGRRR